MRHYRYILFDWDGCLAQSLEIWVKTCQESLAAYGKNPSREEILSRLGTSGIARYFGVSDSTGCTQKIVEGLRSRMATVELHDNVKATLVALQPHTELGIVTTCRKKILEQGLAHNNITSYFSSIITQESVTKTKPHPEGILRAMQELGATQRECLMVGDSVKDIQAATAAGIDSALFLPKVNAQYYKAGFDTIKPTYRFGNFSDLIAIVEINNVRLQSTQASAMMDF